MTQTPLAEWHTLDDATYCGGPGARVDWAAVSCLDCLANRPPRDRDPATLERWLAT